MRTVTRNDAIVRTRHGALRGAAVDGIKIFKGIPYAAPPFGPNRFRRPQPIEPWSGVRDALTFGAKPLGLPYPPPWDTLVPEPDVVGEDCLTLNIWSPELGSAGRPVMVWIPGGMFEHGTAAAYDGGRFARDGIVYVSVNYRVGADGFLCLGDGDANIGLLDQVAALQWVRENIASFGGDPNNVTIFGQSAGAMSAGTLLSMPLAEGLFRRAIAQSGGAHQVTSAAGARLVAQRLAEKLEVDAHREDIGRVASDRLLRAQAEMKAELMARPDPQRWGREALVSMLLWQPVIDGDVLPARPIERVAAGAGANVDVLVGSNLDEWNFFLVPGGALEHITPEVLPPVVAAYGLPVEALATYRAAHQGAGAGELLSAIQSDWYFRIPALQLAEAHAKSRAATYTYEFAWRSPQFNGRLGACHGLEIAFVFDGLGDTADTLSGTTPPQRLADAMHAAWVRFATTGDCGWPKYDLSRRATMRFDTASTVVDDPRPAERALWQNVR